MRFLLALFLCLLTLPAYAGPGQVRSLAVMGSSSEIAFTISGQSAFSASNDTFGATEFNVATGVGVIKALASCSTGAYGYSFVVLTVDDADATLNCAANETKTGQELSLPVAAGLHTVQVGGSYGDGSDNVGISIGTFRKTSP